MKPLTILFAAVLFATGFAPAHAGQLFKSEELKFEIQFPTEPQRQTRTQTFTSGDAQIVRFKAVGEGIRASMSVVVFARGEFSPQEAAAGIEMSGRQQAAGMNGEILSQRDLTINGFAGRETIIKGKVGEHVVFFRAQTFYAGNRQYVFSVIERTLEAISEPADGYFSSFKLWK